METQLLHHLFLPQQQSSSKRKPTSSSSTVDIVEKNTQNRIKNVICSSNNYHRKGSVTLYSYLFLFLFHSTIFIKTIQSHAQQQQHASSVASPYLNVVAAQQCEYKTLEEIPPDPNYDVTDITLEAATDLAIMMARAKLSHHNATIEANRLAKETLMKDDNLLAVAIAAPTLSVAVVQFRDQISLTPPPSPSSSQSSMSSFQANHTGIPMSNKKTYLSAYWRELGAAWNQSDGAQFWGVPFRDCGPLQNRWLWPFSVTVVEHGQKVVTTAFIAADVDECNDALEPIFGRRHSCDRETTFCLMNDMNISAPRANKYTCICRDRYYLPNESLQGFTSAQVESGNMSTSFGSSGMNANFSCLPCPGSCFCDSTGQCLFGDDLDSFSMETLLKAVIGVVLGSCMFFCVVLAIVVARQRKCKTIATGMWTVLETILLGIFLLYLAVALHFLPASTTRCLLEPWLRELGFCICYGAIGLKLYRYLVEFRTRKAHRWVVRDLDLLRYLCAMVIAVLCYLAAFTASCLDFIDQHGELIWHVELKDAPNVTANMCRPFKWDYVTEAGEMLILVFALQLAYATRNAATQFRERQFLVASILIEFVTSTIFYVIRAWYLIDFSPGTLFLALFIRSQLTNTITLGLLFLPKLWYQQKQGHQSVSGHHSSGVGGTYANICMGDPELGDLTIAEMSPEDIRAELKRLYTQLEVLKNKTLRQDNPHISKRRGGRKVAHRRFSLQALSAKRHRPPPSSADMEVTEAEPSRTPEDSVCSIEGGELSGVSVSK
uniref:CSON014205 protein n=1 Tax=Culicoides sonorensis TaxID=179676 RepID=A0A336MEB0_CULSO